MKKPVIDRRNLLKRAAAVAALGSAASTAWTQARTPADPFSLGVASGSPSHDGMVLWTRLLVAGQEPASMGGAPIAVRWELAEDEGFRQMVRSGQALALPELAHAVHVELDGLAPDRWYHYRFMLGDAVSPIGRTRTFPAPDAPASLMRLAYASCQRWEHGYFSAWRHMQAENLDAVLFLGDYIYEYPNAANAVRVPTGGWVISLDDYRRRYALHRSEPELQAMHACCPWILTWDDHEVQNDYAGLQAGDSGPPVGNFAARRAAAYQAFYEHMPLRAAVLTRALAGLAEGAEMRLYGELRFGRLARMLLLDDRQYRDPQACTPGGKLGSGWLDPTGCAHWADPTRTLLGAAQERWLDTALARGGATWSVIGQQTLFGQRDTHVGAGQRLWNDGWDGYSAARARLTDSVQRNRVSNLVMLGGDVHQNWVGHILADYARPDSARLGVEFCGTSITSRSGDAARLPQWLEKNPHFIFADARRKGYGIAEFTPARVTATLRVVDDVTRRDTRIETLARFTAEAGRPVLERG